MSQIPEIQYVTVDGSDVAYRVVGDGPFDLLLFYGIGSHIDMWEDEASAEYLAGLSSFSRVILFDRRGTGASDPVELNAMPTWEEWTEDVRAVLDAVGSERAAICAGMDAGPLAMLFASLHPDRVTALVLANTMARFLVDDDYPVGASRETLEYLLNVIGSLWGKPELTRFINPAIEGDPEFARIYARRLRAAATPHTAAAHFRYIMENVDVRSVLPLIQAPTLVLHTSQNPVIAPELGRYVAEHIPGARFVVVPGRGVSFNDGQARTVALDETAQFLTGERPHLEIDRVLTTILFSDIVASTERAALIGDASWRRLLDAHDRVIRDHLRRFRGREIKTTGDGFFVSFDGPARAIRFAQTVIAATRELGLELRIGIHSGECEVRGADLAGLAVHVAARVGALGGPGDVLVSHTVVDLAAGAGLRFTDRGERDLKGVPGTWRLFSVLS